MITFQSKYLGENELLSRSQYEITVFENGIEIGVVGGETECGHFITQYEEGEITEEILNQVNVQKPWRI